MFSLIHGHRQELLARHLAGLLRDAPLPPFEAEVIVVQSAAMERWLRQTLAREIGIAAQMRFPFPASYLWELFGRVLPDIPRQSPLAPERLHWRLFRLLGQPRPASEAAECFEPLRHYLDGGDLRRRDSLARQLAATFDRYLSFRPDWLDAWRQRRTLGLGLGPHEPWQAALWRELAAELDLPDLHPGTAFLQTLTDDPARRRALPPRISLFGIGNLPPSYLDMLVALGRWIDVRCYVLDPCDAYWGDLVASRDRARAALDQPALAVALDVGHPLLGSFGRLTRQFLDRLIDVADDEVSCFDEPAGTTVLHSLQRDLQALRESPVAWHPQDRSFQVHVCHGPRREVEVLHDQLLACFEADPTLRPADVMVLTPDIETYAPLIDAVFATRATAQRIPYTLADRPAGRQSPLLQAFFALLDLASGRLEAESVMAWLEQPAVARRFGWGEAELERLRDWVRRADIRWGIDGDWRQARGLPGDDGFAWRQGLDRLLLGMALAPDASRELFAGHLPAADISGSDARLLGVFMTVVEQLFAAHDAMGQPHGPERWATLIEGWLLQFFDTAAEADLRAAQSLRRALLDIVSETRAAGCTESLPLAVIRRELEGALEVAATARGFVAGGVTFAALRAWRAVPARVIVLLGMNDGAFPRNPVMPAFDLTLGHARPGDRTARDEDRQALLDVLVSARDALLISYTGRSIRDNTPLPPAAVVAEIFDTVMGSIGEPAWDRLVTVHPLQPFSARYFNGADDRLFSYEAAYAAASRAAATRHAMSSMSSMSATAGETAARAPAGFLTAPLPDPGTDALTGAVEDTLTADALIAFLHNPARALLRDRLGIRLEESEGLLDAAEPFLLDRSLARRLDRTLVEDLLAGVGGDQALALARARGLLPGGPLGATLFEDRHQALTPFAETLRDGLPAPDAVGPLYRFEGAGYVLTGRLPPLGPTGLNLWRVGEPRGPDLLGLWVHHLLLCWVAPAEVPAVSRLLTPAGVTGFGSVADPGAVLTDLLTLFRLGQCQLLPFFPRTALAFVSGERRWREEWQREQGWCESQDPWVDLAWQGIDPLDETFETLARRIVGPLLAALEEAP